MNIKSIIAIAFCAAVMVTTVLFYQSQRSYRADNALTVGVIIGYAPFAMLNDQGDVEGFDIEVARALAQALSKKLVIKDMDLSGLLLSLEQGKIDCVLTGLSITPEREKRIELIHYQGEPTTSFPLVFWDKIPQGVSSIKDLAAFPTATVCVEPGSIQEAFLHQQYPTLSLIHLHAMSDIVLNLQYGKVVAALMDPDIYPTLKKKSPQLVSLEVPLDPQFQSRGIGIGINKHNTSLINQVRSIIDALKRDGTLARLEQQWLNV